MFKRGNNLLYIGFIIPRVDFFIKPLKNLINSEEQHSHLLRLPFYVPSFNYYIFYLLSRHSLEDNQIAQS